MKRSIYITHQGAHVSRRDGMLAVTIDGALVERWPVDEVGRMLVFGNVQLTTQAIALMLANQIQVAFFSSSGRFRGHLVGPESGNVFLRLAQHERFQEPEFRLAWARELIVQKVSDARDRLLRFRRNHPEVSEALERAASDLLASLRQVRTATDIDALRGHEGQAAAVYFSVFDQMIRGPLTFERRSQHPAHNGVNALLNLGYTLLASEIAGRLEAAGFDPRIGFFHGVRYGRLSLALDVLEGHRVATVDRVVLAAVNRRVVSPDDFEDHGGRRGVRLQRDALRRFLNLYEEGLGDLAPGEASTTRSRLEGTVMELRRTVLGGEPATEAA